MPTKKELKELQKLQKMQQATLEQKQNMVKWIAIGVVSVLFLVLFVGAVIITKQSKNPSDPNASSVTFTDAGHSRMSGTTDASSVSAQVTLTEFADLQCPACRQYHPIVNNLLDLYPGQVKLVFKHFPITSIHKNALTAAVAAEAAGRQNKFFEMVDIMYERQDDWANLPDPRDTFLSYAEEIGLDLPKFKEDAADESIATLVEDQRNEGINAGVNGTPAFFVNGVRIDNPQDISGFQAAIDPLLSPTQNTLPTSAPTTAEDLPLQP